MNVVARCTACFVVIALLLSGSVLPTSAQTAGGDYGAVDAYIAETMRRLPIAGLSVAIVKGDQVVYMQGYGIADDKGAPVTPQTPFMLASVTKTFTALAVRQLVAAGKLDLDARLQSIVPEFTLADPVAAAAVTIRHLLDHTSGISTQEGTRPYLNSTEATFTEALSGLARYYPTHRPGEQFEYSNWNYVLLGEVIARTAGQPYADYVQTHVFDPLDMHRASFADHHTIPGAATGNYISFGLRVPYDEKHIPVSLSAGWLTASAEDMAHYLIPFFNQGQYQGRSLLPVQGTGWFNATWNWQAGHSGDVAYNFSGAHNSFNTAIELFSLHRVGVVVLMNTRLDTVIPGPTAGEIAFNLGRLVIGFPYEIPSNQVFYGGYALLDGFLLLMVFSIFWQGAHLGGWGKRYRAGYLRGRIWAWTGIAFNLCIAVGIVLLPALLNSYWELFIYYRSDVAAAFLGVCGLLAALGFVKIIMALKK